MDMAYEKEIREMVEERVKLLPEEMKGIEFMVAMAGGGAVPSRYDMSGETMSALIGMARRGDTWNAISFAWFLGFYRGSKATKNGKFDADQLRRKYEREKKKMAAAADPDQE